MADLDGRDSLMAIFERQEKLQRESFGIDMQWMSTEERIEFIRWNVLAIMSELGEALNEVGWKPWASDRFIDEKFGKELVDVLHFLVNLWLVVGWNTSDVVAGYFAKADVNKQRQAAGYEHGSLKCPTCSRALDEPSASRDEPSASRDEPEIDHMRKSRCVCGNPETPGVVHRTNGPCYILYEVGG